jgi:hypothetical protein
MSIPRSSGLRVGQEWTVLVRAGSRTSASGARKKQKGQPWTGWETQHAVLEPTGEKNKGLEAKAACIPSRDNNAMSIYAKDLCLSVCMPVGLSVCLSV